MSVPTLRILLLAGYMGGVHPAPTPLASSLAPNCSPLCVDGQCMPVSVQKLDDGYCHCALMRMSESSAHTFSVKQMGNNTILIRWRRKLQENKSALLYLPVGEAGVCFNVTTQRRTWDRHVKVECTHSDLINMQDNRFRLVKMDNFQTVAVSKDNRAKGRTMGKTLKPPCTIPDAVYIKQTNSTRLEVNWFPLVSGRDLRVFLQQDGSDYNQETKLPVWPVCRDHITSWTFDNVTPGSYKAKVGLFGCDDIIYRESDPFQPQQYYTTTTEAAQCEQANSALSTIPSVADPDPPVPLMRMSVYVVGVLAFICCTSLGIACHFITVHWYPKRYKWFNPEYVNYTTKITIVGNMKDEEKAVVMTWLSSSLKQPHVEVEIVEDLTLITKDEKNLLVNVTLDDVETFSEPHLDAWPNNMSITILTDHRSSVCTENRGPLLAFVPAGFLHPGFEEIRNNEKSCSRILDIRELLQRLNPRYEPKRAEVGRFLKGIQERRYEKERDKSQRIFLVSWSDNPHHVQACLELSKLIRSLGKEVICNLEENIEGTEEDVTEWTTNQITSSGLVLIVLSKSLNMMVERGGFIELQADLRNQALCTFSAIETTTKDYRGWVWFLHFGDSAGSLRKCPIVRTILKCHGDFNLLDGEYSLVHDHNSDDRKRSRSGALELFLSTLTSDVGRVQKAISDSDRFFQRIDKLIEMIRYEI